MDTIKKSKIRITGFDGVIGRDMSGSDEVIEVDLKELYEFKNHPFRVTDDVKMRELSESIKKYGVLSPIIIRPRSGGGYEIVSGHRRKRASEIAGLKKIPAFCRNYTDAEAVVMMVDSNLQREELLPSEKAFAYKMKYEAVKKVKKRGDGRTLKSVSDVDGCSQKTIQRYIWLTRLTPSLLGMVDSGEIDFRSGVEFSFLSKESQAIVEDFITEYGIKVKYKFAKDIHMADNELPIDKERLKRIIIPVKKHRQNVVISGELIEKYFPDSYSDEEIKSVIEEALKGGHGVHKTSETSKVDTVTTKRLK